MLVIVLVLAAAAVGALGLVLLRKATEAEPERPQFSLKLLWVLIRRRPVWAAGIVTLAAGFVLQVIALANGPVSRVQLVIVMELPFCLILSRLMLGGRLRAREWSALAAMTVRSAARNSSGSLDKAMTARVRAASTSGGATMNAIAWP